MSLISVPLAVSCLSIVGSKPQSCLAIFITNAIDDGVYNRKDKIIVMNHGLYNSYKIAVKKMETLYRNFIRLLQILNPTQDKWEVYDI